MVSKSDLVYKILPYKSDYYQQVFDMVLEGSMEGWTTAYTQTFTFSQPVALSLRAALYAVFLVWLPMPWPVTCCAFYEVFLTAYVYFDIFFIYTWQNTLSNMTDYRLSHWTTKPNKLLVAVETDEAADMLRRRAAPRNASKEEDAKPRVAGCAALVRHSETEYELFRLHVPIAFRCRGVATALIGDLLSTLRDGDSVRLMTVTANHEAMQLYRKLGFRLVKTAPFDYGALTPRFLRRILPHFHGVRDLHYELRITKETKEKNR